MVDNFRITGHPILDDLKDRKKVRIRVDGKDIEAFEGESITAGLQPFSELCWQLNLKMHYISALGGFVPVHDKYLQTSMPDIYIAGDLAGIEEASTAMEEGRLAGKVAAWRLGYLDKAGFDSYFDEINMRLKELRLGSFGIEREKGKKLLLDSLNTN